MGLGWVPPMIGMRKPLGLALQSSIMPGDQPDYGMGDFPKVPHAYAQTGEATKPGFFREGGMGRMLAGIIGDALAQQAGMRPVYAPAMQQRQALEAEEAQWTRRRQAEREDKQWEWNNAPKSDDGFTAMMRAAGIDPASDAGRALYGQRLQRQVAEPDVIQTLPNGQLYAGPRSGLAGALTGVAPVSAPMKPVGKLTPVAGGPQVAPAATFRR